MIPMDEIKKRIATAIEEAGEELDALSKEIFENPELGWQEFRACKLHTDFLKKHGFVVEENFLDYETAYKGAYKAEKPGPVIAYLAEYDALPGIGHGCGHNILGATSLGAAIGLKAVVDDLGGTVEIYGTPAEETSGAKVAMADKGVFNHIDTALIAHPGSQYMESGTAYALEPVEFEFFGQTSHAAASPEKGLNALDAAINTFNNINALRQQIRSDARVHGIILEGGKAANIIPDYTRAQFYVRALTKTYLKDLSQRVKNCARGAALAAGCRLEMNQYEECYDSMVPNKTLNRLFEESLGQYTDAVVHPHDGNNGSTDTGNVSQVCPAIHPYFDVTGDTGVIGHTVELAACTLKPYAKEQMRFTSSALALMGARLMAEKDLLAKVKEEFEKAEK